MKKVSIIVPVYNTSLYLRECLNSIKNQTLKDIEVIVVDDGSTDSSPAICDEYAVSDERFKVFHNQNQGVSASRNFGIDKADSEFVIFVDSDDWLENDMCENLYQSACENSVDMVICAHFNESTIGSSSRHMYNTDMMFNGGYFEEIRVHTLGLIGRWLKKPSSLDRHTPIWARLYRLDIIKNSNIRYIDLNKLPSECLQFNFAYTSVAKSGYFLNRPLYHYRRNTVQSVTKPYRVNLLSKWLWWYEYMKENYVATFDAACLQAFYSRMCCRGIPLGGNALKLHTYREIRNECATFLRNTALKESYRYFKYHQCALHWRIFFTAAKYQWIDVFIILTWGMRKILALRKK